MDEIKGILDRIRSGMATAEDAEAIWALLTVRDERIRLLEAANRRYAKRFEALEGEGEQESA
jgi:hypothetical protein